MQNMLFYLAICHVLDAKRLPFTLQKVTFYKPNNKVQYFKISSYYLSRRKFKSFFIVIL